MLGMFSFRARFRILRAGRAVLDFRGDFRPPACPVVDWKCMFVNFQFPCFCLVVLSHRNVLSPRLQPLRSVLLSTSEDCGLRCILWRVVSYIDRVCAAGFRVADIRSVEVVCSVPA